jgi:hypothetical protein
LYNIGDSFKIWMKKYLGFKGGARKIKTTIFIENYEGD